MMMPHDQQQQQRRSSSVALLFIPTGPDIVIASRTLTLNVRQTSFGRHTNTRLVEAAER
jgi:hypothetical protein